MRVGNINIGSEKNGKGKETKEKGKKKIHY